jgi:hypothetical protein
MHSPYGSHNPRLACRRLENLVHKLEAAHPAAAASLREGWKNSEPKWGLRLPVWEWKLPSTISTCVFLSTTRCLTVEIW